MDKAAQNRAEIAEIKRQYDAREITRDEAKVLAQPVIDRINEQAKAKTKELNEKYKTNRKAYTVDFIGLMRSDY